MEVPDIDNLGKLLSLRQQLPRLGTGRGFDMSLNR
jgi:hypothetical protein